MAEELDLAQYGRCLCPALDGCDLMMMLNYTSSSVRKAATHVVCRCKRSAYYVQNSGNKVLCDVANWVNNPFRSCSGHVANSSWKLF